MQVRVQPGVRSLSEFVESRAHQGKEKPGVGRQGRADAAPEQKPVCRTGLSWHAPVSVTSGADSVDRPTAQPVQASYLQGGTHALPLTWPQEPPRNPPLRSSRPAPTVPGGDWSAGASAAPPLTGADAARVSHAGGWWQLRQHAGHRQFGERSAWGAFYLGVCPPGRAQGVHTSPYDESPVCVQPGPRPCLHPGQCERAPRGRPAPSGHVQVSGS